MRRMGRLKYIGATGKHGFVVKIKYSTEAINLIRFLGCLLKMDDTHYLSIPVTDMPIFFNSSEQGRRSTKSSKVYCICNDNVINIINCMGSQF